MPFGATTPMPVTTTLRMGAEPPARSETRGFFLPLFSN
jgi:hypothetical protein